jgi:hypothetical protein
VFTSNRYPSGHLDGDFFPATIEDDLDLYLPHNASKVLGVSRFYNASAVEVAVKNPKIISGIVTINGDGSNSYASATVDFDALNAAYAGIRVCGSWATVISSAAGGVSNSQYTAAVSGLPSFDVETNPHQFDIHIRHVAGTAIAASGVNVKVQWFVMTYET